MGDVLFVPADDKIALVKIKIINKLNFLPMAGCQFTDEYID
jgi:hypothetical protein